MMWTVNEVRPQSDCEVTVTCGESRPFVEMASGLWVRSVTTETRSLGQRGLLLILLVTSRKPLRCPAKDGGDGCSVWLSLSKEDFFDRLFMFGCLISFSFCFLQIIAYSLTTACEVRIAKSSSLAQVVPRSLIQMVQSLV